MTELQQALALDGTVTADDGTEYRLGGTTAEVMGGWEDFLASETLDRLLRIHGKRPNGEAQAIKAVAEMSEEGAFDFFGESSQKRMQTLSGLKRLVYLRIKQNHPDVPKKTIDAVVEREWETLFREIQKEMAAQDALLPNDEAPETGQSLNVSAGEASSLKSATSSTPSPAKNESAD